MGENRILHEFEGFSEAGRLYVALSERLPRSLAPLTRHVAA